MPELPEVETVCRGLLDKLLYSKVYNVNVINNKLRYHITCNLEKRILRTRIKGIIRRGKNGFIIFNNNEILNFHLGMTGKFIIKCDNYQKKKHDHLVIQFDNKKKLIYNDVRKFGYIILQKKPLDIFNFKKIGCEPFLVSSFKEELFLKIKKRKTAIKDILLDQNFICGIGNIYASEILFHAKISPFIKGFQVNKFYFSKLLESIKYILNLAIKKGGSSIKDYSNANNELGYFQTEFKVYGRAGHICYNCKNLITITKQRGRSTYYCKKCQP